MDLDFTNLSLGIAVVAVFRAYEPRVPENPRFFYEKQTVICLGNNVCSSAGELAVSLREQATLVPLVVLCIWIGVYPKPFLAPLRVPVEAIMARINGTQTATVPVDQPAATAAPVGN